MGYEGGTSLLNFGTQYMPLGDLFNVVNYTVHILTQVGIIRSRIHSERTGYII